MTQKKIAKLEFYSRLTEQDRHPSTVYKVSVMESFLAGKQIQFWNPDSKEWQDCITEPAWAWSRVEYREKPEN